MGRGFGAVVVLDMKYGRPIAGMATPCAKELRGRRFHRVAHGP